VSLLSDTEAQLEALSAPKRWAVIAGTAMMILALGWYGWIEDLQMQADGMETKAEQLQQKVLRNDLRLYAAKIKKVQRTRLALAEKLQRKEAAKRYLQSRFESIGFIWFNQRGFAQLLDRILKKSVELGVRIDLVEVKDAGRPLTPLIETKKRLDIEGGGRFADIVKLATYIESLEAMLKIDDLGFELDKGGKSLFHMTVLTYGGKR
jgi:Tfp pilus assembly protein PilO